MSATVGTRGKAVHAIYSGKTLCGSEYAYARNGNPPAKLHLGNEKVTCGKCLKIMANKPEPVTVPPPVVYGPNAGPNFALMAQSAPTEAGRLFWATKLLSLPV